MKYDKFDYDKYLRVCEEIEERSKGFHKGEFLPVMQWNLGDNTYTFDCQDKERMLENQLEGMSLTLDTKNDQLPHLEPWHGVGVFAEAFGCPFEWSETDAPWTRVIVDDLEGLKRLESPKIEDSKMLKMVLDTTEYFVEKTKGQIAIGATDTQSPLSTMSLICDVTWMMFDAPEHPDEFHRALSMVTDLIIEFTKKQRALCPKTGTPGHTMWSTSQVDGISLSADMMALVGRDYYEEFGKPYDDRIGKELGGVGMHSCGKWHHNYEMVKSMENLSMIDLAISLPWDPGPSIPEKIAEAFGGTNIPVQARCDVQDIEAIDMLIRSDTRMIFSLFWDNDPAVRARNYDMVKDLWYKYKEGK